MTDLLGDPDDVNVRYDGVLAGSGGALVPPATPVYKHHMMAVFDGRGAAWRARKKAWRAIIPVVTGRKEKILGSGSITFTDPQFYTLKAEAEAKLGRKLDTKEFTEEHYQRIERRDDFQWGTSRFDPMLAETLLSLWSKPGDMVLDPWAGGVERGVVAAAMGRRYMGVDLRQEQVDANHAAVEGITWPEGEPLWFSGDTTAYVWPPGEASFAFGCPPYWHLEEYAGGERDLSGMTIGAFARAMRDTFALLRDGLAANAFAAIVVGDCRRKDGQRFFGAVPQVVLAAALDAGFGYGGDAIYLPPVGRKRVLAPANFKHRRSLTLAAESVLILVKGNQKQAAERLKEEA